MKNRLRKREREAVRNKYASNDFYKMMTTGGREMEKQLGHFRLSVEELFLETMTVVDDVKESPREAIEELADLWNKLYCDYRDMDVADSPDEELRMAASEVVFVVLQLLHLRKGTNYSRISTCLMDQLTALHPEAFSRLSVLFMPKVWLMGERNLKIRMNAYMESDEWISDEIEEMLVELPTETQMEVKSPKESTNMTSALTNRQLVILFEHLLDISLQPEYTNIKALSQLLGEVSGRSAGSIRQTIMNGIDYESTSVHKDIDRLESLLRPIKETLADQIKNSKEEK